MDARRGQVAAGEVFAAQPVRDPTTLFDADPDRKTRWAAWREENADAMASWNALIEEHGLPLERYRTF